MKTIAKRTGKNTRFWLANVKRYSSICLSCFKQIAHSEKEPRHYVLGHTIAGRRLFIAFTVREDKIRWISARDMSKKERKIYEQANS